MQIENDLIKGKKQKKKFLKEFLDKLLMET